MGDSIYFTKVEFRRYEGFDGIISNYVLDLVNKELVYQIFGEKKNPTPAAMAFGTTYDVVHGHLMEWGPDDVIYRLVVELNSNFPHPFSDIRSGKTNFKANFVKQEEYDREVKLSKGLRLSDDDIAGLLPYCNALEYEGYRNRIPSMNDLGYRGYLDGQELYFIGVSDSYLPVIMLPMYYAYDKKHIWPCEKLYEYMMANFSGRLEKEKKNVYKCI